MLLSDWESREEVICGNVVRPQNVFHFKNNSCTHAATLRLQAAPKEEGGSVGGASHRLQLRGACVDWRRRAGETGEDKEQRTSTNLIRFISNVFVGLFEKDASNV